MSGNPNQTPPQQFTCCLKSETDTIYVSHNSASSYFYPKIRLQTLKGPTYHSSAGETTPAASSGSNTGIAEGSAGGVLTTEHSAPRCLRGSYNSQQLGIAASSLNTFLHNCPYVTLNMNYHTKRHALDSE